MASAVVFAVPLVANVALSEETLLAATGAFVGRMIADTGL